MQAGLDQVHANLQLLAYYLSKYLHICRYKYIICLSTCIFAGTSILLAYKLKLGLNKHEFAARRHKEHLQPAFAVTI